MTTEAASRDAAPRLEDLVGDGVRSALLETHTALPGRIESFDPATQRATVVPELRRQARFDDGEEIEVSIAPIPEVPVLFPRAGGVSITFPVAAGDKCLLVFAERDISAWLESGIEGLPPDARRHSYSDAVAILGLSPATGALDPAPSTSELVIRSDDGATSIEVGPAGISITSDGPVSIDAGGAISITRDVNELLTILATALDAIATSTVSGSPLSNAATIAAERLKILAMQLP